MPSTSWETCGLDRGPPGAARDLQEALGIYRVLGDRPGQAHALTYWGSGSG